MAPETKNADKTVDLQFLNTLAPHVHWLVRAALAAIFVFHGVGKFPAAAGLAEMMGMPIAMIYLLGVVEIVAGALLVIGGFGSDLATRLGALMLVPVMLGAIILVHAPRWSFTATEAFPMGGMEFQVLILALAIYLAVRGNAVNGLQSS